MEQFGKTVKLVTKFCFCATAGYFAFKALDHVLNKKHYTLMIYKLRRNINRMLQLNAEKQLDRESDVDFKFFWSENINCKKHISTKMPCDINFCSYYKLEYITNFISSATESIDLCMFLLTSTDIARSIINSHKKGIKVRVIVEEEMSSSSESKIQLLIHEGILVKSKILPMFMHHKFCLVDGNNPKKCKLLTGSLNWTLQGVAGNWENIIIVQHRQVVNAFHDEFNKIWDYFTETQKKSLAPRNAFARNYFSSKKYM